MARTLKILFLGSMAVGKTSLIRRITKGGFESDYKSTLGVQLHEVEIHAAGGAQKVILWDTDGEAETAIVTSPYARGADAAMLVCDASRPETGQTLLALADAMMDALPGRPFLGVINKVDLKQPDPGMTAEIEQECDLTAQTSAKTGEGCDDAIMALVELVLQRMDN